VIVSSFFIDVSPWSFDGCRWNWTEQGQLARHL
jgi:hypothetical protein